MRYLRRIRRTRNNQQLYTKRRKQWMIGSERYGFDTNRDILQTSFDYSMAIIIAFVRIKAMLSSLSDYHAN